MPMEKGEKEDAKVFEAEDDVIIKPGDYRIQVNILEAKDLIPPKGIGGMFFGNKSGSADPIVSVEIGDQKKTSKPAKKTLNPIFGDTLFFEF